MDGRGDFVFNDKERTVYDPRTGIMFFRNGNYWKKSMGWYDAKNLIERLNFEGFGGFRNWRLPTMKELQVISLYAISAGFGNLGGPTLAEYFNNVGFDEILPDWYWSSDVHTAPPDLTNVDDIWCVSMGEKDSQSFHFSEKHFLWPVRDSEE